MTLPRIFNFWNVNTQKPPKYRKKTDQAEHIGNIDRLAGHRTDQNFYT